MFPLSCFSDPGNAELLRQYNQRVQGWWWMDTGDAQTYNSAKRPARCWGSREDRLYSLLGLLLSTFTSVLALTELLLL